MIKRSENEIVDNSGISEAKQFWSGITTVPTILNGYGEKMYSGSLTVNDDVNSPAFDGYCRLELMQSEPLIGSGNSHYVALRETQYLLPIFRAEDTKIYMPLAVVFDWTGDADSFITMELFSSDAQNSVYTKIIFSNRKASIFINGTEMTIPPIEGFFSADRVTRKLGLRVITQNKTGYVEKGTSILGTMQIALTDMDSNIVRVLHIGDYVVNPFRTYQFEARLSHK